MKIAGDSTQFHCGMKFTTVETMYWQFDEKDIYRYYLSIAYPSNETNYYVNRTLSGTNFGYFILNIKHTTLRDGGNYTCLTLDDRKTGNLLVFGKYISVILLYTLFYHFLSINKYS